MSFNINSDKEFVRGSKPRLIGDQELTIRSGTGSAEKEILRAQLDANTALPRVGINRTGERVNEVTITAGGSGYTTEPSVQIDPPGTPGGVQALASAFIFNGQVVNIAINNPGSGYTSAPGVTITGGNGGGATATTVLDTVDFELDINGAIRTSTSIISDTARILNLDIDNFITPDTNFRAPNLKTFMNNTGTEWGANVIVQKDAYRYFGANVYQAINAGQTGPDAPDHVDGIVLNGEVQFKHIGFRANDTNSFKYGETGEAGIFPRSITPLLGDRSDKIATTEYVLNLATNDVGGRIYVSQTIGSDLNDGRSAVNPVRTIKKAAQLAWATPGVKETLIVSGGDYVEDNPISLPPDASVVGDNLRLVIIRPANPGKHIFKFGDKNYVIGVTYRDQIDSIGDAVATWDFAMVFDDKQRIIIDNEVNGDFGVNFPIGHQIFGPDQFRVNFQENTGLAALTAGLEVVGVNTGARAKLIDVNFTTTTGVDAYLTGNVDVQLTSGSFLEGERFNYIVTGTQGSSIALTITGTAGENVFRTTDDPDALIPPGTYIYLDDTDDSSFTQGFYEVKTIDDDNSPTYWDIEVVPILNSPGWDTTATETININAANVTVNSFDTTSLKSIRAEGEVVSYDDDITTTVPIQRLDFSLQGDPSIATGGFQNSQFGNAEDLGGIVFYTNELVGRSNIHDFKEGQEILIEGLPTSSPDLSVLNGKQRIYKVLEDADGRARRFVIPKKLPAITDANFDPGTVATAKSFSKAITLSLLNSPNSFPISTPVERRFQDACVFLRNNREFIADEVVGQINDEFKTDHYRVYDVSGNDFKIYLGTVDHANDYDNANPTGTVTFGGTSYNISDFVYDHAVTGVATVTTGTVIPSLTEDDVVKLAGLEISCSAGTKIYPSYSSPTSGGNTGTNGDEQCRQDVIHFVNAVVRDLEFGTNHNVIDAARKYIVNDRIAFIEDEIVQNVRAVEYARRMCVLAMRNWREDDGTTNDPIYTPKYSSLPRYFDDTVITTTAGTPACADVKAAIDTLAFLWGDVITNNQNGTYLDGAYLIARNADLIADQAYEDTEVAYPEINNTNVNERKCTRDTKLVLKGLVKDLVLGGNNGIVDAAESYFSGSTLTGVPVSEIPYVRYAYERAKIYCKSAAKNWSAAGSQGGGVVSRVVSNATYSATSGQLIIQMPDASVPVGFGANSTSRVAFQLGAMTFNCAHNGGGDDAVPKIFDSNVGKSYEILSFSSSAGVTSIEMNVGPAGSNTDTHTFVSGSALLINDYVAMSSPIPKFEDWSILVDDGTGATCANVDASIDTSFALLDSILEYSVDVNNGTEPGSTTKTYGTLYDTNDIITYPDNFIYDQNNTRMAIRADYDDFPIIEASPYTQNASVISFLGGGGALVDGSKVKQPNCPFPGLELDGTASFPNQGKSMVASAFTIVSFGGTGYKIINDGYTQLVSVFVIFCADGVLAESGGYASITNSATNFGIYALRGIGYRAECYSFDVGTISNVSSTPTGRTILTVTGLGREPLEHYIVKVDGYRNTNTDIEFFVDAVSGVTVGPPFSAQLTLDNGTGDALDLTDLSNGNAVSPGTLTGQTIKLHRPSIVNSSSHTWEFAGSGTNYLALPENGGTKVEAFEQVSEQYGRVYVSGTDELGDFKVGTFARIENRTGAITFTGTVTISEVEFLKLKGGDVVVTGFDASNTLGGANSSDSKLPTQKAVKDYITNNLGPYINKPFSTNAIPRNLVELTDSGKISVDQIPALRPFEVFTVANTAERLALEGALAGDIAIEQDTSTSFILNNDLDSQFLAFGIDTTIQFTIGDIFTGSITGGRLQATEYRQGVVYQINITQGGSGYASPPTVTLTGGTPQAGNIEAKAEAIIANGEVVAIDLIVFNGYKGGKGYTVPPNVQIAAPAGSGVAATANALIESRLYGDIVNRIKLADNDFIETSDIPAVDIDITRVVNTSSFNSLNWVSLSSNQLSANQIVSGTIETDRLATGGAANSFTFLRGDQNFALAVQSVKGAERRYFAKLTSTCNSGSSEMVFATLADALVGHEVKNNISGIQPNTNITGVLTSGGSTTIGLNNPVTATIAAGTIIEFERGESPMIFESTYTQGNFVDDLIISNGGTGFTNGQYFDLDVIGGTGTGAKMNVIISGGAITEITITDGGSGYNADFTMTVPPTEIGGGSGLVLLAKISTVNRQYANVSMDVQRVSDLTISSDLFGTIGVARFKKSQFIVGQAGNGSVELDVGADSGLDADLLDGQQGEYYTNATNLFSGTVSPDRLSGTYNISISGSSGNTLRLSTGTNNPTSNPSPDNFAGGIVSNTINNTANGLADGGTKNMVLTLRAGGTSFDASFGGVRQLAFTDNDNMYLRGSGTGVTNFGSWAKVWHSLNDGIGSELDADRLDNKQGYWYQNALNVNFGTLSDNRLPEFMSSKVIQDDLTIKSFNGDPKFRIYISGLILNTTPFTPGSNVNLYDANGQGTGTIAIDNVVINNDPDNTNDYTILIGRLVTGNFVGAKTIGDAGNRKEFQDFTIEDGNTVQVAKLESDGGTANLRLGRKDSIASSPGVYFNSSVSAANYNVGLVATGGNATDGSGTLNCLVANADGFNVNGNVVWNAGNIEFQSSNIASTAVKRDASGNFAAGTITATITGSASLNVLKAGDSMSGSLNITGTGSTLTVSGDATFSSRALVTGDLVVDTDTLFVDVSADRVGINAGVSPVYNLDVRGDLGLGIYSATNANGASKITFSDHAAGSYAQKGFFQYLHGDGSISGTSYNNYFIMDSTEANLLFKVGSASSPGTLSVTQAIGIQTDTPSYPLDVNGSGRVRGTFYVDSGNDNSGAPIEFFGAANYRNFRIGNQLIANHIFSFQASNSNGNNDWNTTPALQMDGSTNAVSINTTATSGTDPSNNTVRAYKLNVQGDVNFNGQLFQDNQEFVTSRWTEASNTADIYRLSKVGINRADPDYTLDVGGEANIRGITRVNADAQYLDTYGVVKRNRNSISENLTIGGADNAASYGPITIASGYTVTISSGGVWNIL